jgi:DNA primase
MAGIFSPATLDRVRAASDIVDVIGGYLPLKRAGASFVALCPFHREKTPSFHVNPHRQTFHCFGCNKGGDVFTFVKEHENVDFPEAVRRLAERARIPIEYESGGPDAEARGVKERLFQIHEQITTRWQTALANEASGQIARDYLSRRQVLAEAIQLFRLGYAPDQWDDTVNWARSKGHDLALVEKSGLIVRKENSNHFYDRFRGRLMFPICDEQGRVIGFSGRILTGDEKTAKYVNSPETPIFTKSKVFFGLDKSKRALLTEECAVVCEGQLDLIACFMAGVKNIVAPQGTAFTAEHARILRRYVPEVVLCFDSDQAGQNATVRSLDHLLGSGLAIRVAVVPSPHDPDSFIKAQGGDAFRKLVAEAQGFFDYYLARLCAANDVATDRGRLTVLRGMAQAVQKTGNAVLLDQYAQKTALRLGVAPEAVRKEFAKAHPPSNQPAELPEELETDSVPRQPLSAHESWLLKLLFLHEDLIGWAAAHLQLEWIPNTLVRGIFDQRFTAHQHGSWTNTANFVAALHSPEQQILITEAIAQERPLPNPAQQLADIAMRLRNQFLDRQMADLLLQANQPQIPDEQRLDLLRQHAELRQQKRRPLPPPNG